MSVATFHEIRVVGTRTNVVGAIKFECGWIRFLCIDVVLFQTLTGNTDRTTDLMLYLFGILFGGGE
jgi:hypothetical protein